MLSFAASLDPVGVVLAVVGGTGLFGGVVAFMKLRPDVNTAMVTQAQGAAETMAVLQRELVADRDSWHVRATDCECRIEQLEQRIEQLEEQLEIANASLRRATSGAE